jgi:hypothetical protein
MKRILTAAVLVFLALPLANCQTTNQESPMRTVVVAPPVNLYKCPLPKKPNTETLTDSQTADYLNRLYKARATCGASLNSIKRYSNRAVKEVENASHTR